MGDAGTDMVGQKIPVKGVDGGIDRGGLHQNIRALGVLFHHAADAANLALNAAEPVAQALPLCFGPLLCLMAAAAGRGPDFRSVHTITSGQDTPRGVF